MIKNRVIFSILSFCLHVTVLAAPYSPSYTVKNVKDVYTVNHDGTFLEEVTYEYRIHSEDGIKALSQLPLSYSSSLAELDVIEAYTLTQDGKKIPVTPEHILLQQSPVSAGAPMFDDAKVKNVIFPAVGIGSVLHLHYRYHQKIPLFPGVFAMVTAFPRTEDYDLATLEIHAPKNLPLYVDSVDISGGEVMSTYPDRKVWRWILNQARAEAPESGSVSAMDVSPRIAVSSLPNYQAIAQAYQERARVKAAITPFIQQLADEITQGIHDRKSQAEALYRWVSTSIRYVAIYFGFGGVVPHDADTIARARYGDCKDHVTLLEALLAAKGIPSSPVLVNSSDTWWLPSVAVPTGVFNHAITYLPEWQVFVDSTAEFAPFGVLPLQERGKMALVIDKGNGEPGLLRLPLMSVTTDTVKVETRLHLTLDGTLQGSSQVAQYGVPELLTRALFSRIRAGTETQVAGQILTMNREQGSGDLALGDAHDLALPYDYSSTFYLRDYVDLRSPVGLMIPIGIGSLMGLAEIAGRMTSLPERHFPFIVSSGRVTETTLLELPKGAKVLSLPRPMNIEKPFAFYQSYYAQQGNTVKVVRALQRKFPGMVLPAADYPAVRQFGLEMSRDLRAQILIK